MRLIPTRVHGVLDYVVGALLIAAPWLLGFSENGMATRVAIMIGALIIAYSAFTDYELGIVRAIPMKVHLVLDFCSGIFLAISPWVLGYADRVFLPHLLVGLFAIGAALMTQRYPTPSADRKKHIRGPAH